MSLVELARYPTRIEADLARLALEAEGIGAVIMDSEMNNFFGGAGLIGVGSMGAGRRLSPICGCDTIW